MNTQLLVEKNDVALRKYEWGAVRRFMSGTGPDGEVYVSAGTLATEGLSLGEGVVKPHSGKISPIHPKEEESYLIVRGTGIVIVGKTKIPVTPGSVIYLPVGIDHTMSNESRDEPLEYVFAVGFPRSGQKSTNGKRRVVQEADVATREYEWGVARRFMSVAGPDWEQYISEGTIFTEGLSMGRTIIRPKGSKPPSVHENEEEAYLFIKGKGFCTVDDQKILVAPGSVVYIPAGVYHGTTNEGNEPLEYIFALGFLRPV